MSNERARSGGSDARVSGKNSRNNNTGRKSSSNLFSMLLLFTVQKGNGVQKSDEQSRLHLSCSATSNELRSCSEHGG
jgi:hypothetical protein